MAAFIRLLFIENYYYGIPSVMNYTFCDYFFLSVQYYDCFRQHVCDVTLSEFELKMDICVNILCLCQVQVP